MALTMGAAAGLVAPNPKIWGGRGALEHFLAGKYTKGFDVIKANYLGLNRNNKFDPSLLAHGFGPLLGGFLIHKVASKLGVNRELGRAGVPILRI